MEILMIIVELFFVIAFQTAGIGFHVVQKVRELDREHPDKKIKEIYSLFFENEWSSLSISALILATDFLTHVAIIIFYPSLRGMDFKLPFIDFEVPYIAASFILAIVMGYGGQRIMYKLLGRSEKYLSKE